MNEITEAKQVSSHSIIEAAFTLQWESHLASHTERYHFHKLNVWRDLDLLPREIQSQVLGRPRGHIGRHAFAAGTLVPAWSEANLVRVKQGQFDRNPVGVRHQQRHVAVVPVVPANPALFFVKVEPAIQ